MYMDQERWDRWEARRMRRMASLEERRLRRGPGRGLAGLFVIAIGVLFLLGNLGIIYVSDIWQYWPVILIVLGLSRMVDVHDFGHVLWGGVMAMVGGVFLLHNLGYIYGSVWQFIWPLVLIAVGVGMLARGFFSRPYWQPPLGTFGSVGTVSNENTLHVDAVFHHIRRKIDSQDFQGGKIDSVFGGVEIDLRNAAIKQEEVVIRATAVFGGIELWVPDTWKTVVRGSAVFGGYEDQTHPLNPADDGKAPRLIVTGDAVFGGVTVRN